MYLSKFAKQNLLALGICFWTISAFGQGDAPQQFIPSERTNLLATTESWNGLYLKFRLGDRWLWYQENHYRRRSSVDNRGDFIGRMSQIYNRFGFTYLARDNFEITFGPTLVWNFTPDPGNPEFVTSTLEPRFWHQWLLVQPMGRVKLFHQFRFEHRFKRDNNVGAPYNYTDRFRYKVYAYIPINKPRMENHTFFISPSNEIFFETGSHITDILEENRIYTAIGYTHNNFMFFGGHMWTYGPSAIPAEYRQRHIIRLNVMYTLDFRDSRNVRRALVR
ncbi:DUF2490 domain-containing protein [Anditalea andensis]|uniref:DUF2490 domain-containing protein n=1 Tax=Anditalea andensis TaxID=1048983 RepID=A0A074KW83_9BACT|nr:DUF2490 domain-containing protein [Anditalea andensis]KEO72500.1 hypothetical protein EL17_17330 [Anditalea andensis]